MGLTQVDTTLKEKTIAHPEIEVWIETGCIAVVQDRSMRGDPYCGRGGRVPLDDLLRGAQPLCHQHRDKIECDLQRWMLGLDRFIVPTNEQLTYWGEPLSRCTAWVVVGDDLPEDLARCGHWTVLVDAFGGQPPAVPLCAAHAVALAWSMRAAWNEHLHDDPRAPEDRPGWGWMLARDSEMTQPDWQPYWENGHGRATTASRRA